MSKNKFSRDAESRKLKSLYVEHSACPVRCVFEFVLLESLNIWAHSTSQRTPVWAHCFGDM